MTFKKTITLFILVIFLLFWLLLFLAKAFKISLRSKKQSSFPFQALFFYSLCFFVCTVFNSSNTLNCFFFFADLTSNKLLLLNGSTQRLSAHDGNELNILPFIGETIFLMQQLTFLQPSMPSLLLVLRTNIVSFFHLLKGSSFSQSRNNNICTFVRLLVSFMSLMYLVISKNSVIFSCYLFEKHDW